MHPFFAEAPPPGVCFGLVILAVIFGGPFVLYHWILHAIKSHEEKKEAEFQQKHPELWRQRELLKLEKERLAAEKERMVAEQEAAKKQANHEAVRRGVGAAAVIGRMLGWW